MDAEFIFIFAKTNIQEESPLQLKKAQYILTATWK